MIRLERPEPPVELDGPMVAALTAEYQSTGVSVWNKPYIRELLLIASYSKCAYCETKVDEESKYMEVDHFRCKKDYPDQVVLWENLLPSCKRCNGNKSAHNVDIDGMIVNPLDIDPRNHLYFRNYRLRGKDQLGQSTIEALYLNQSDRMVAVRYAIGETIASAVERIRGYVEDYVAGTISNRQRNKIIRGLEKLLMEASPAAQFGATTATALVTDPDYIWIRERLESLDLWGDLIDLDHSAQECALLP